MDLMIEVTRKCNLRCEHCLRGDCENVNIKKEYITTMLESIKTTTDDGLNITFTGGEPTLNLSAIQHTIKEIKRLNMNLISFYIATNGRQLDLEFMFICAQLYELADEKEICSVELSADMQHNFIDVDLKGLELFKCLRFFDYRDKNRDYSQSSDVILEGHASDNYTRGQFKPIPKIDFEDFEESLRWQEIYLNALGNIILGCDWSYYTQENLEDIQLCHVDGFENWYNRHASADSLVC